MARKREHENRDSLDNAVKVFDPDVMLPPNYEELEKRHRKKEALA